MKLLFPIVLAFLLWEPHEKVILALLSRARKTMQTQAHDAASVHTCETHKKIIEQSESDLAFPVARQAFSRPER